MLQHITKKIPQRQISLSNLLEGRENSIPRTLTPSHQSTLAWFEWYYINSLSAGIPSKRGIYLSKINKQLVPSFSAHPLGLFSIPQLFHVLWLFLEFKGTDSSFTLPSLKPKNRGNDNNSSYQYLLPFYIHGTKNNLFLLLQKYIFSHNCAHFRHPEHCMFPASHTSSFTSQIISVNSKWKVVRPRSTKGSWV